MKTIQHQLQQFDPGIVWLDGDNQVMALNTIASEIFGTNASELIGQEILQFHPESSRAKVSWLLESASCPMESPPPMTMMINIPDRVLLVKVCKMLSDNTSAGTCMIFFDLTDVTTTPHQEEEGIAQPRRLYKLPVYKNNKVLLVGLEEVVHLKSEGHYTNVFTKDEQYLCNLSLTNLGERLSTDQFVRTHRSHMINMGFAKYFEKIDDQCYLIMDTEDEVALPVSRSKVKMLRTMLGLG
ncbi:MAG: PAS domain-containing transcriptional regulator [Gammaproteobacteria bacterium]|nr:PAS domain-containing transcriptional regulator [Gammaproteobacteria bacterium]